MGLVKKILRNQKYVALTPIITTALLEMANINQVIRMWTERSAEGQSIIAWVMVNIALFLWLNFYLVMGEREKMKWAIRGTMLGIGLNSLVIMSVIYFRYL